MNFKKLQNYDIIMYNYLYYYYQKKQIKFILDTE